MGARLMAIVAEGDRERVYLNAIPEHVEAACRARPTWRPELALPSDPRAFWTPAYGVTAFGDLFTPRQLVALTTFSDLVSEAMRRVREDAVAAGLPDDDRALRDGGTGARAYAEAVAVYLAFAVSKVADRGSSLGTLGSNAYTKRDHQHLQSASHTNGLGTSVKSNPIGKFRIWLASCGASKALLRR